MNPAPCSVERTSRSVIEHKLLVALENDESKVAILATKQDLEDMIAALYGYEISETIGNTISWHAHLTRRKALADGMSQLLREAFPPKDKP